MAIDPIIFMNFLKFCISIICIVITMFSVCGMIKTHNKIASFKGLVVDGKFFRHYECPKCNARINIQKDSVCKNCQSKLF